MTKKRELKTEDLNLSAILNNAEKTVEEKMRFKKNQTQKPKKRIRKEG